MATVHTWEHLLHDETGSTQREDEKYIEIPGQQQQTWDNTVRQAAEDVGNQIDEAPFLDKKTPVLFSTRMYLLPHMPLSTTLWARLAFKRCVPED